MWLYTAEITTSIKMQFVWRYTAEITTSAEIKLVWRYTAEIITSVEKELAWQYTVISSRFKKAESYIINWKHLFREQSPQHAHMQSVISVAYLANPSVFMHMGFLSQFLLFHLTIVQKQAQISKQTAMNATKH
jgi:hypothetical protein